jgi:hypothetical protein
MLNQREFEELVKQCVPPLFLSQAVRDITKCYGEAESLCDTYGINKELANWSKPFVRRSMIESRLFETAQRFPQLAPELRHSINGMPYLAIVAGPLTITESKIEAPGVLPPEANYRSENSLVNYKPLCRAGAGSSGQPNLFNSWSHSPSDGTVPVPRRVAFAGWSLLARSPYDRLA